MGFLRSREKTGGAGVAFTPSAKKNVHGRCGPYGNEAD
jgi:hypothetical protein